MLFGVFSGGYWERHTDLSIALRFSVRPLALVYVCLFGLLLVYLCSGLHIWAVSKRNANERPPHQRLTRQRSLRPFIFSSNTASPQRDCSAPRLLRSPMPCGGRKSLCNPSTPVLSIFRLQRRNWGRNQLLCPFCRLLRVHIHSPGT